MDPQDRFLLAMFEVELERERQKRRQMEQSLSAHHAALHEKERERAMLMTKKEEMLAEEAAKEKLVDDFMVFIEATENNDPEIVQNFDEKAMMNTILHMMTSDCGDGGNKGRFVGGDKVPEINLDPEEKSINDAIIAMINNDGNFGGNNGGFTGGNGGINNVPENAENLGDEAMVAANREKKQ